MTFDITLVNTTALWWDALFVWPRLDVEPVRVVAHTTAFELQHTHRPCQCHRLTDSFTPRSTQNRSFRRRIPMPISRLGVEKILNLTQQKYAFTNQKKCTTTQNKHKKLKPCLVAFYDKRPRNGAGLFSKEKISKGGNK